VWAGYPLAVLVRRALAGWLVGLALSAAWFANIALWVRSDVLDASTFSDETSDLLTDATIRSLLVDRLSDELVEQAPELSPFTQQIEQAVDQVVASPEFSLILSDTISSAHRALFSGTGEPVTLDLAPAEEPIRQAVGSVVPEAAAFVPVGVYDQVQLVGAGDVPSVADQADWVRDTAPVVALLAAALAGAAVIVSSRRPGTLRMLGFGLVGMAALSYGTVWLIRNVALGQIGDDDAREAADTVAGVATDAFVRRCLLLGALGVAIAAAGFVLSGLLRSLQSGGWGGGGGGYGYDDRGYGATGASAGYGQGYGAGYDRAGAGSGYHAAGRPAPHVGTPAGSGRPVDRRRPGGTYL
jgi:hypothetical protein